MRTNTGQPVHRTESTKNSGSLVKLSDTHFRTNNSITSSFMIDFASGFEYSVMQVRAPHEARFSLNLKALSIGQSAHEQ